MKSKILVGLQFSIIFLMSLSIGTPVAHLYLGLLFIIAGFLIGLMAIKTHQRGNFNIRPDIKDNCTLVTHGIYSYIRHPMYLSVLTAMLGFVFLYPTWMEGILYLLLLATLLVKLFYEENLWVCHTPEYETYKQRTKRLIPFIF